MIANENLGRTCKKCSKFKAWDCFGKKPNGQNGRESRCKVCRKREQASRRKKMRAKKHMVIDGENLVIESQIVGDLAGVDIDAVAMIIAQAYNNREMENG